MFVVFNFERAIGEVADGDVIEAEVAPVVFFLLISTGSADEFLLLLPGDGVIADTIIAAWGTQTDFGQHVCVTLLHDEVDLSPAFTDQLAARKV